MNRKINPPKSSNAIRREFLNYFQQQAHTLVPSSSLVPQNDPTLLFTNAGMVQFKDVFLGKELRIFTRAVSSQRCVRAGGKHNDLERVGYTARHHTFFEMLGNFSFGDYFKKDAIIFAWDFLINHLGLPAEKLWVTIYKDDQEAENIWLNEIKIEPKRFSRCEEADNFWAMGPTGPCGPCTEIFYDHGPSIAGGPPGSADADGDRYVEIWNLVFMQYNRAADGTLTPLPKPSVDTGMGLERITAVMQGVHNNYDTDLFQPLIKKTAKLAGLTDLTNFSLRVIADHIRSCSFIIADGIKPSNEGRGYVLRRIIRRALRHGQKLGLKGPFFYQLLAPLIEIMGEAYPELIQRRSLIEKTLRQEEEQFSITLTQGLKLFDQIVSELKDDIISGETVFKLYDTYGFPADLTADIARERQLMIDYDGFEAQMAKQKERSRKSSQFTANYQVETIQSAPTEFTGHKNLDEALFETAAVLAIYQDGQFVNSIKKGEKASIVLDRTSFYAESGGQVGDQGILQNNDTRFKVLDTIKQEHTHLHLGKLQSGHLTVGQTVTAEVDKKRRAAIVLNHTATHLLHMVLRKILGNDVVQKGSLVEPERLRFDFAYHQPLTQKELQTIEYQVNQEIRANHAASVSVTTPQEAVASGALALFGEKYGKTVRVVQFGSSVELCGGTHADQTGQIGFFKIVSESGIASGIRRLEAVTGDAALTYLENREKAHHQNAILAESKVNELEKEIVQLKEHLAFQFSKELVKYTIDINGIKVLAKKVEGLDGKSLRIVIDQLKDQLGRAVIVLAAVKDKKIRLIGGVTENLSDQLNAKDMINHIAKQVGGKGGGKALLAEAGGNQPEHLEEALHSLVIWIKSKL